VNTLSIMCHGHYLDKKSVELLSEALVKHYAKQPRHSEIAIVCIGTNRNSLDSLGPAVGSRLLERLQGHPRIRVYGTLDKPIHALNIHRQLESIARAHPDAYMIAVDACIGQFFKIGTLQFVEEPLVPGLGLEKELPPVGHVHFKGVVNNHSALNPKVMEHGSLTFVHEMAAVLSRILVKASGNIVPMLAAPAAEGSPSRTLSSTS